MVMRVIGLAAVVAFLSVSAMAHTLQLRGKVGDNMCRLKNTTVSCVRKCIASGIPPVLIVGKRVYRIANPASLKRYPGQEVIVRGQMHGQLLQVEYVRLVHTAK